MAFVVAQEAKTALNDEKGVRKGLSTRVASSVALNVSMEECELSENILH